jgi:hypothetical protein
VVFTQTLAQAVPKKHFPAIVEHFLIEE